MSRFPEIAAPTRKPYISDLSDREWEVIKPLLPAPKGFGCPRNVDLRDILNAIFYVQRTGCQWEMLPHDFPPYTTVYGYFQKWQRKGIWQQIHDKLRSKLREKHSKQIEYTEYAIDGDEQAREAMVKRGSDGKSSVPQIFINNVHVGGSDALYQLEAEGKLDNLLTQSELVHC